jgi:hypothetical protein
MTPGNTSILDGRVFRIGLFSVLAVVVLAGAAYLWGTGLRAAGPQAIALAPSYNELAGVAGIRSLDSVAGSPAIALAPSFNELAGVAGIRTLDAAAATRPEAADRLVPLARYMGFAGIAGVRAADVSVVVRPLLAGIAAVRVTDASALDRSSLLGLAAVRVVDQTALTPSAPGVGAGTQGLSTLELRRTHSQTSAP